VVHQGRSSANTTVGEIATMQDKLIVASIDDSVQDCVDAMGSREIRHMPVADPKSGEFVGLLSIREVARALAKEREAAFKKLEDVQVSAQMPIHDG
jgi:predicted transcriptional regulator